MKLQVANNMNALKLLRKYIIALKIEDVLSVMSAHCKAMTMTMVLRLFADCHSADRSTDVVVVKLSS